MSAPASGPVPDLSIFIIARDEADRIGRTIAAVRASRTISSWWTAARRMTRSPSPRRWARASSTMTGRATARRSASPKTSAATTGCSTSMPTRSRLPIWSRRSGARSPAEPRDRRLPHPHRRDLSGRGAAASPRLCAGTGQALPPRPGPLCRQHRARPRRLRWRADARSPEGRPAPLFRAIHRRADGQAEPLHRPAGRDLALRGESVPSWRLFVEFPLSFFKAYVMRGMRSAASTAS